MDQHNTMYQLQRYLVYVLRHNPQELGLVLGKDGFVPIEEVVRGLQSQKKYTWATEGSVREAVASQPNKQRLQIDGKSIRVRYGHSATTIGEITYVPEEPPDFLYHGTPVANLDSILEQGLLPGRRKYVHLSDSVQLAQKVGTRHGSEVAVIAVLARKAGNEGIEFYHPEPLIWLVEKIPPQFLQIS